jgi:dTDP-4-amino-4,6-dideoxygalactose transaminase
MVCFSFHPVKPITTGEGGMVTTNNPELAERLRRFRSHGIVRKPEHGEWYYEVEDLGYHYRMTDIQAALGLSQMKKLDAFIARRNELANQYRELLSGISIGLPPSAPKGFLHGYHLFAVLVPDRARVFSELRAKGIGVQVHYVPIHLHPSTASMAPDQGSLPTTEKVYGGLVSLPIHPGLDDADISHVVSSLTDTLNG